MLKKIGLLLSISFWGTAAFAQIITTVVGNGFGHGTYGYGGYAGDGGLAIKAELNLPWGIAVGRDQSIYISDYYNHRICKVDKNGVMHTIAGIPSFN